MSGPALNQSTADTLLHEEQKLFIHNPFPTWKKGTSKPGMGRPMTGSGWMPTFEWLWQGKNCKQMQMPEKIGAMCHLLGTALHNIPIAWCMQLLNCFGIAGKAGHSYIVNENEYWIKCASSYCLCWLHLSHYQTGLQSRMWEQLLFKAWDENLENQSTKYHHNSANKVNMDYVEGKRNMYTSNMEAGTDHPHL